MSTITISVSGKIFVIDLETITKSNLFKNIIDDIGIPTSTLFINRSPKLFEHVLAYLIDENYPYPLKYQSELKYFLIDFDPNTLYDQSKNIISIKATVEYLEKKFNEHFNKKTCVNCNDPVAISLRCANHSEYPECMLCYNPCASDKEYCDEHEAEINN